MHVQKINKKKTGKQQICKLTLPLSQIHQNILVFATHTCIFHYHKQSMYLPLNKTKQIGFPHFIQISPFLSCIDKDKSIKSNKGIKNQGYTKQFNSIENRDNSPYEQQRLKTSFSPYKNRKHKTSVEKNNFGDNLGGGEK